MSVSSYRGLKVWQMSLQVAEQIYHLTQGFPRHEAYGLSSQMQRAAVSLPANIAEGHARDSTREFLHHLSIALGSLAELETQILLAERLHYVEQNCSQTIIAQMDEVGKMLRGLQKALKSKLAPSP